MISPIPVTNARGGWVVALSLVACHLLAVATPAQDSERPARMKDLPRAVRATVGEQSRGAVVRGLSREVENGQVFYEVALKVNGRNRDVLIDAAGGVVAIEEQVTLAELPPAAKAEIVRRVGKGRILVVESITKNAAVVAYEAHVRAAGKMTEIKVDPAGKPYEP